LPSCSIRPGDAAIPPTATTPLTMRYWPSHTLTPNLLTDCFLDPKRQRLPPSVLAQLYVAVPAEAPAAPASRTRQPPLKAATRPTAKAPTAAKPIRVQPSAKPAVQRITGIAELQALGLHALEQELQRRGLKSGGTLIQRAERVAAIGGIRVEPAPAASEPAQKPAAAARKEAGKRMREPEVSVRSSVADEFAGAMRRDPAKGSAAPKGSGGPALRAPDPNSKRSQMKASTGFAHAWFGPGGPEGGRGKAGAHGKSPGGARKAKGRR